MIKTIQILLLVCGICRTMSAQNDTVWFDADWNPAAKSSAEFYRPAPQKEENFFRIMDYYVNGAKQCEGLSQIQDDIQWQGRVTWFYPDGDTLQTASYDAGMLNGKFKSFYNSSQVHAERHFVNGKEEGQYRGYYPDGKISLEMNFRKGKQNGQVVKYFRNGQVQISGNKINDSNDSAWVEYFDNGKLKTLIDYSMGDVKGRHHIFEKENDSYIKLEISNGTLVSADIRKSDENHTFQRRMELNGNREHWRLYNGNDLLLEYFFEGYNRAGVWTKYANDGKMMIDRFQHKNANCYFAGNTLVVSEYGFGALQEKFTMTDFEQEKSDCLNGKGEFMTEYGDRVKYEYKNGKYKSKIPLEQRVPHASNMAEEEEITVIDYPWGEPPEIEPEWLPELTKTVFTVNEISFTQHKGTFDGIQLNILSYPDYHQCKAAWKTLLPSENELLFYFNGDGLFKAKMGNTARVKYKQDILNLNDLSACIRQLFKEEHFYFWDVKDALFYASERLFRETDDDYDYDDYYDGVVMPAAAEDDLNAEEVFVFVEEMPQFPGGEMEMLSFIRNNLDYPREAKDKNIEGKVIIQFTVYRNGSVGDIKVLRSVHPLLDAEAVRVIAHMPKWIPGKQQGKEVNTQYNIPIVFKMQ